MYQTVVFVGSMCLIGYLFHRIIKADQLRKEEEEPLLKITPDRQYQPPAHQQSKFIPPVGSPNWQRNRISQYFDSQSSFPW